MEWRYHEKYQCRNDMINPFFKVHRKMMQCLFLASALDVFFCEFSLLYVWLYVGLFFCSPISKCLTHQRSDWLPKNAKWLFFKVQGLVLFACIYSNTNRSCRISCRRHFLRVYNPKSLRTCMSSILKVICFCPCSTKKSFCAILFMQTKSSFSLFFPHWRAFRTPEEIKFKSKYGPLGFGLEVSILFQAKCKSHILF